MWYEVDAQFTLEPMCMVHIFLLCQLEWNPQRNFQFNADLLKGKAGTTISPVESRQDGPDCVSDFFNDDLAVLVVRLLLAAVSVRLLVLVFAARVRGPALIGRGRRGRLLVPGDDFVPQDGAQDGLDLEAGLDQATGRGDHGRCQRAWKFGKKNLLKN